MPNNNEFNNGQNGLWIHSVRYLARHAEFFHNSRLIRQIQQNEMYKKFRDLSRD